MVIIRKVVFDGLPKEKTSFHITMANVFQLLTLCHCKNIGRRWNCPLFPAEKFLLQKHQLFFSWNQRKHDYFHFLCSILIGRSFVRTFIRSDNCLPLLSTGGLCLDDFVLTCSLQFLCCDLCDEAGMCPPWTALREVTLLSLDIVLVPVTGSVLAAPRSWLFGQWLDNTRLILTISSRM